MWVPEWHKPGHGLHVHFAVGQFIPRRAIEATWGRGFVHIKLLGDRPVGSGVHAEARKAAGYLSKYVGKGFEDVKVAGVHRYEVALGFQPERRVLQARMLDEIVVQAAAMGGPPLYRRQSQVSEGRQGPPAVRLSWDSPAARVDGLRCGVVPAPGGAGESR